MALTDRHFLAEHFDILFAFFWVVVQKIWNFKVWIIFCLFFYFQKFGPKRFAPGSGLATAADGWVPGHGGKPRRPRPTARFDLGAGMPRPASRGGDRRQRCGRIRRVRARRSPIGGGFDAVWHGGPRMGGAAMWWSTERRARRRRAAADGG